MSAKNDDGVFIAFTPELMAIAEEVGLFGVAIGKGIESNPANLEPPFIFCT